MWAEPQWQGTGEQDPVGGKTLAGCTGTKEVALTSRKEGALRELGSSAVGPRLGSGQQLLCSAGSEGAGAARHRAQPCGLSKRPRRSGRLLRVPKLRPSEPAGTGPRLGTSHDPTVSASPLGWQRPGGNVHAVRSDPVFPALSAVTTECCEDWRPPSLMSTGDGPCKDGLSQPQSCRGAPQASPRR